MGFTFAILAAVCWGTYGVFIKILNGYGVQGLTIVALAPTVLVVFFLGKILYKKPKILIVKRRLFILLAIHGLILLTLQNYSYVKAVSMIPIGIVSTIAFSHVFLLMITTRIVFKYKLTAVKISGGLMAIFGVSLVLDVFNLGNSSLNIVGILWALLIPINYSIAYTLNKYYLEKGVEYEAISFYTNLFSAMFLWISVSPLAIVKEIAGSASVYGFIVWLVVLGFALLPQITAYTFFLKAYEKLEPCYVSIMFSLEPFTATILAFLFFRQTISSVQIIGMVVIMIALIFSQYKEINKEKELVPPNRCITMKP